MIKKEKASNETFIHFTYKWNTESILNNGLKASRTGQMVVDETDGEGVYACKADDVEAIAAILEFMEREVSWVKVEEYLQPEDEDEFIPLEDFVDAVVFTYTGDYFICEEENEVLKKGYVLIQTPCIPKENIAIDNSYLQFAPEPSVDTVIDFMKDFI